MIPGSADNGKRDSANLCQTSCRITHGEFADVRCLDSGAHGFTIIAKIKPGTEPEIRAYVGLGLTVQQILEPLRNGRLVVLSLLANFVLAPAAAIGLARLLGSRNRSG